MSKRQIVERLKDVENTLAEEQALGFIEEEPVEVQAMAHRKAMDRQGKMLTVKKIVEYNAQNRLNFDLAIQRGYVWKDAQIGY